MTERRACRGGETTTMVRPFTHCLEFEKCPECWQAVAWDMINDERLGFRAICKQPRRTND